MAAVAGVGCAGGLVLPGPGVLAALVGLGAGLGPRGAWVLWWAVGAWAGLLAGVSTPPPFETARPVTAIIEVTGYPKASTQPGWADISVRGRSWVVGQGGSLGAWRQTVFLSLPEDGPAVLPGMRLRVRGFLRASVAPNNGGHRPPGTLRLRVESARFVHVVRPAPGWRQPLAWARGRIERALGSGGGTNASAGPGALVRTLVLGQGDALAPDLLVGLRRAGLAHLTAVSGLHVGVWAGFALLVLAPMGRLGLAAAGLVVIVYASLAGLPASALRAMGMTLILMLARALERPPAATNALAVTVLALALVDPPLVSRFGFQLSVMATWGILALGRPIAARLGRRPGPLRPGPLRLSIGASIAAQLATVPWTLPRFALIAPLAPLTNLVLAPWLLIALVATGLWSVVAVAAPDRAARILPWLDPLVRPLEGLAALSAAPWWTWIGSPPAPAAWIGVGLFVAWMLRWRCLTACLAAVLLVSCPHATPRPVPHFAMLDVGQGDALLLRDGPRAVLVDGGGWIGGDVAGRVVLPALARRGVKRLDAVVVTHPDWDHCGGLISITRYLPVERLWIAPGWPPDDPCIHGLRSRSGLVEEHLTRGMTRRVGRWHLEVLHPTAGTSRLERNDRSLVLRASVSGRRFLLTGDLQAAGERALLQRPRATLRADVLKLGHHGSATSSGRPFLAAIQPRLALVSAGRANRFGHPAPSVQERLRHLGIQLLRTDQGGAIDVYLPPDGPPRISRPPW